MTTPLPVPHDYSLVGASARHAIEAGLANGAWYRAPIPRARLKELIGHTPVQVIVGSIIGILIAIILQK